MSVYPINTHNQTIYTAHNSEDANAYSTAFITGGFNFTVTYEQFIHRGVKQETWLFIREKAKS